MREFTEEYTFRKNTDQQDLRRRITCCDQIRRRDEDVVSWVPTFVRTESPLLVLVIVGFSGTPQLMVRAALYGALRVPLLHEEEGELAGATEGVTVQRERL